MATYSRSTTAAIVVVSVLLGIACIAGIIFAVCFFLRRHERKRRAHFMLTSQLLQRPQGTQQHQRPLDDDDDNDNGRFNDDIDYPL